MPADPIGLLVVIVLSVAFGFAAGRATKATEREETALKRIIARKYQARVEREKIKSAEQVAREIDGFVSHLTKGAPDPIDPRD